MQDLSVSDAEMLKFAVENGMLNTALVHREIEMQKRKEILSKHPYEIWEGKNGKWYTYIPDKEKGRVLKKRKTREDIEKVVIDYIKEDMQNPTVENVFNQWCERKLELKEITPPTYDRYISDFNRYFSEFRSKRIKGVSEMDIEDFLLEQLSKHKLTAKAFSNLKTIVRGIFKRAKKMNYVNFSITQLIDDMEVSKRSFKKVIKEDYEEVFMEDEYPLVWNYLQDNMTVENVGIMLMFLTGMRVGELVAIRMSDIHGNVIKIRATETRYRDKETNKYVYEVKDNPKTNAGIRNVVVPKDYEHLLKRLKLANPFGEFLLEKDGVRVKTYEIRKKVYQACEASGAYKKSPHKVRKTYASMLLDNKVDKVIITEQMGHVDISCTENFYHRNRKSIDRKSEVLSSIPELMAK